MSVRRGKQTRGHLMKVSRMSNQGCGQRHRKGLTVEREISDPPHSTNKERDNAQIYMIQERGDYVSRVKLVQIK